MISQALGRLKSCGEAMTMYKMLLILEGSSTCFVPLRRTFSSLVKEKGDIFSTKLKWTVLFTLAYLEDFSILCKFLSSCHVLTVQILDWSSSMPWWQTRKPIKWVHLKLISSLSLEDCAKVFWWIFSWFRLSIKSSI